MSCCADEVTGGDGPGTPRLAVGSEGILYGWALVNACITRWKWDGEFII